MSDLGKTRIVIQGRSDGDGMENTSFAENEEQISTHSILPKTFENYNSKGFISAVGKQKEPRFVPYEPYKAAVSPIIPHSTKHEKNVSPACIIDSQKVSSLASSVIKLNLCKEQHPKLEDKNIILKDDHSICKLQSEEKILSLERKISQLEMERKELEAQFSIQAEVNADLKKMLVAALGEDMQLKVQYMTEDKARLGMNALQFFEELRSKNEDIEKISIQCDIWKSKFEASSVMVDELAEWKAALSREINEAVQALDSLLKEYNIISDPLYESYNVLQHIVATFNPGVCSTEHRYYPQTLTDLSKEILSLAVSVQERLLGKSCLPKDSSYENKRQLTPAERSAYWVLKSYEKFPISVKISLDKGTKHSPGTTACQVLPHVCSKDTIVNCCKHCSGEIKLL